MSSKTVTIFDYQPHWREEFEVIASELRSVLAADAMQIDHIGSTAVVGLCAKNTIDVQVTVQTLNDVIAQKLLETGYTIFTDMWRHDHVPPGFEQNQDDWIKLFFMQRPGARRSNIHIRQAGKPNQRYALLVRDFLRANPSTAQAYGRLKQRLAAQLADLDTYPDVKDPVADIIYFAAERWALDTNWEQTALG